jgi:hypothetical protein
MHDRFCQIDESLLPGAARPYKWVTSDKAHIERNESALTLIADISRDIAFRCNGPGGDIAAAKSCASHRAPRRFTAQER